KLFKKNIVKNFGPGSKYWKNLSLRKKYKKIKWKTAMKGPWIHQNILETIKNIKLKKTITGGIKINESDGYCASLPFYFSNNSDQKTKEIIRTVANSKISEQFAMAKLKIIELADKGDKDPIGTFLRKNVKNKYFKNVIENIKKVKKIKSKPHNFVVKKFGKACSYPGTFNGAIHAIITSKNFKTAIVKTIKAGGCNCSRANFVGAYFAAYKGLKGIPQDWIKKTNPSKSIMKLIA
ncbi:ADP-ribosylglycohydrolase family protein, partial [Candidatus Pelagibacter sp.]|nr:ADP-ribosylglycohydrolase family protein [Candidatus Pelagibacter sp.]